MKSDWLEAFLIFSDTLNFTKSAEYLHISQPALHVKIRKLSEHIGKPLYQKSGRNLVLTAEGLQLQSFARNQLEQTQDFLNILRGGSIQEEVCLSAGEGTFLYLLGKPLSTFINRSSVKLNIRTGDHKQIQNDVLSGDANIGILPMDADHPNLTGIPFSKVGQILVMPESHSLASKRRFSLHALNGEKLVVPPAIKPHRVLINRLLMDAQVEWEASIEVTRWELMLRFVQQGLGLAIVNEYCSIPKGLVAKPLPQFPSLQFQIIQRSGSSDRESVKELIRTLLEYKDSWKDGRKNNLHE